MSETRCGSVENPQPISFSDNSLLSSKTHKFTGYFDVFSPNHCEFCGCRITNHDRIEAPYADGRYLCAMCRAEYMDLHHADPFLVMMMPEEGTA